MQQGIPAGAKNCNHTKICKVTWHRAGTQCKGEIASRASKGGKGKASVSSLKPTQSKLTNQDKKVVISYAIRALRHIDDDYTFTRLSNNIIVNKLDNKDIVETISPEIFAGNVRKAKDGKENEQTLIDMSERLKDEMAPDELKATCQQEMKKAIQYGAECINSRLATAQGSDARNLAKLRNTRDRLQDLSQSPSLTERDARGALKDLDDSVHIAPETLYVNQEDSSPDDLDQTEIAMGFLSRNLERKSVFDG